MESKTSKQPASSLANKEKKKEKGDLVTDACLVCAKPAIPVMNLNTCGVRESCTNLSI